MNSRKASFERELNIIARAKARYVWGGYEDESTGLDCSGSVFLAGKRAGLVGIKRTTALDMANGNHGWDHDSLELCDAENCDLVWWTWRDKPNRRHGHVGAFVLGPSSGLLEVFDASTHHGCWIHPLTGVYERDLSRIGRLKQLR